MADGGPLSKGSTLANGKYVIEETLGAGGFGITYRATDNLLTRTVAIKELYPEGSQRRDSNVTVPLTYTQGRWEKAVADFLREARTIASLEYPSIVAVYDYFQENNTAYMVMRFVDGVDLVRQMILRGGKLPEAEALQYVTEVGVALEVLHSRGVLHRDIKPSNILVNRQGHAVLVDFGAAREFTIDGANTHTVMASYGFAPPEQFHAKAPRGPYTDIYSLAATCYYLLTGTLPTSDVEDGPEIRPELRAALEHAMAYDPQQRPQNVATFIAELQGRITPPAPESFAHPAANSELPLAEAALPGSGQSQPGAISAEVTRTVPNEQRLNPLAANADPTVGASQPGPAQPNLLASQPSPPDQYGQQPISPSYPPPPYEPGVGEAGAGLSADDAGKRRRGTPWFLIGGVLAATVALVVLLVIFIGGNNKPNPPGVAIVTSPTAGRGPTATAGAAGGAVSPTAAEDTPTVEGQTPTLDTPVPTSALSTSSTVSSDLANVYLYGVSMDTPDDGWAVGTVLTGGANAFTPGVLMHYHNQKWERDHTTTDIPGLNAVDMLSADDGWAVGGTYIPTDKGIILHRSDGKWQTLADPVPGVQLPTLNGLYMVSKDEGWAVGGGVIVHYHNGNWALDDNPISNTGLLGVYMLNANEGWAVGGSGTIIHYLNGTWSLVNSGTGGALNSVYMTSADDGWAVGQGEIKAGDNQVSGVILHYTGGKWVSVPLTIQDQLHAISMISPREGWAVGGYGAGLWNYTNGGWAGVDNTVSLGGIQMLGANDGWAVGGDGQEPVILHFGNDQWTRFDLSTAATPDNGGATDVTPTSESTPASGLDTATPASITSYLNGLFMTSSTDGWAVGGTSDRNGLILHYSDAQWTLAETPSAGLITMDMISPTEGWAVGYSGEMLQYSDGAWAEIDKTTKQDLYGLYMTSADEGWAVGLNGAILHYSGGQWSSVDGVTTSNLYGVSMSSAADGWIVGQDGLMLHYSGGKWVVSDKVTTHTLHNVQMLSADEGWTLGDNGIMLHYNGGKWTAVDSGTSIILHSIDMSSAAEGWAVGYQGVIVHYTNGKWTRVDSHTTNYLRCVFVVAANDVWAVSDKGSILHFTNGDWTQVTAPYSNLLPSCRPVQTLNRTSIISPSLTI